MSLHFKSLITESCKLSSGQLLGIVIAALTTVVVTRVLGPEGRGVYTWVLALSMVGVQIGTLGMDTTNRFLGGRAPEDAPKLVGASISMAFLGSFLIIPLFLFFGSMFPIGASNPWELWAALLSIPFAILGYSLGSLLVSLNRSVKVAQTNIYPRIITLFIVLGLIFLDGIDVLTIVVASVFGSILGAMLTLYYLKDKIKAGDFSFSLAPVRGMWKYAASAFLAGIFFHLMQKIDILMLGGMLDAQQTGYFSAAAALADIMLIPAGAISMVILGKFAGIADHEQRKALKVKAALTVLIVVGSGCFLVSALSYWIVLVLFGSAFVPATIVLQLLSPAVLILSLYLIFQNSIAATQRARMIIISPLVGCISNVILNFILIPVYGIVGAALASIVSYSLALACAYMLDKFLLRER